MSAAAGIVTVASDNASAGEDGDAPDHRSAAAICLDD